MESKTFNLLDESWIRVVRTNSKENTLSLKDVFIHAHEYADLSGELPAQDIAMLRFLLAVLHAVFARVDETGAEAPLKERKDAYKRWKTLWDLGHFPEKPILDYLERWRSRFDLFDPIHPFWQVPAAKDATTSESAKLNGEILKSGNPHKYRIFSSRTGEEKDTLSFAEAARWLLFTNAFDDAGVKASPQEKRMNKKLVSAGKGWLGDLGLISAKGDTLFETLLLNLILLEPGKKPWKSCTPIWEREESGKGVREEVLRPQHDQAALLTWQSRRLLLCREGDTVTGVHRVAGDLFLAQKDERAKDMFAEQMTMWKPNRKKRGKETIVDGYLPKPHDRSRRLWHDFASLTAKSEAESDGKNNHAPGIVSWTQQLIEEELLPETGYLCFRIVSVSYDNNGSSIVDSFEDSLTFHRNLLTKLGNAWMERIEAEVKDCGKLAKCIADLTIHLHYAEAGKKEGKDVKGEEARLREQAKEQFYYRIDIPFREWLRSLEPAQGEEREKDWRETAYRIAEQLGKELVSQAGPVAFRGRMISVENNGDKEDSKRNTKKGGQEKEFYSAAKESRIFKNRLNKWKRGEDI